MDEAMEKLSRYSVNVEQDLETLIFSMLNLIDTKTKTLKKLIKLHLQIRNIRKSANLKYKRHFEPKEKKSDDNLPILAKDSVDELTFSEDFQKHLKEKDVNISYPMSHCSSIEDCGEITAELKDCSNNMESNNNENAADTTDDEQVFSRTENISIVEAPKECNNAVKVRVFSASQFTFRNCSTSTTLAANNDEKTFKTTTSTQFEPEDHEPENPKIAQFTIQNQLHPTTQTIVHSCLSSINDFCIVSNLQGIMYTLKDCLPGDSGFLIDSTSYNGILNALERILTTCDLSNYSKANAEGDESNRSKLIEMSKCSTQPTLKATYEELPKRMISSSTECNKIPKKKMKV